MNIRVRWSMQTQKVNLESKKGRKMSINKTKGFTVEAPLPHRSMEV